MKKPSSYQKLKAENTALKAKNTALECRVEKLESELAKVNNKLERMCDLLLANTDTQNQKFIYYKGDDNNSVGKLVSIGSKREGYDSTSYPYVVE
ncbi:hypothetical protein MPG21_00445 [Helicobacter pylori]|uniref:hypothetical protein n=1 Tax=Helicobacter pylori TaxID=210 RepID=UPI001C7FF862|nr:hypothetical protein [Helicobacter pylori]UOS21556.1 hypothetical protein MPG21_00445 [Helicobacter pylori]